MDWTLLAFFDIPASEGPQGPAHLGTGFGVEDGAVHTPFQAKASVRCLTVPEALSTTGQEPV